MHQGEEEIIRVKSTLVLKLLFYIWNEYNS